MVFTIINESGKTAEIGQHICGARFQLHIRGITTEEYGEFCEMKVVSGRIGYESETVRIIKSFTEVFVIDMMIDFELHHYQSMSYVRLEGFTKHRKAAMQTDSVTQTLYGFSTYE